MTGVVIRWRNVETNTDTWRRPGKGEGRNWSSTSQGTARLPAKYQAAERCGTDPLWQPQKEPKKTPHWDAFLLCSFCGIELYLWEHFCKKWWEVAGAKTTTFVEKREKKMKFEVNGSVFHRNTYFSFAFVGVVYLILPPVWFNTELEEKATPLSAVTWPLELAFE